MQKIKVFILIMGFLVSRLSFAGIDGNLTSTMFESDGTTYFCPTGFHGAIAADDREAAQLGVDILGKGGNAIDAAIQTAFVMAVTRPHYAAIGGGGLMVYCPALKPDCIVLDFRESAPANSSVKMFDDTNGKVNSDKSQNGALASGVPGMSAGLLFALEKYGSGKITREKILANPIRLAKKGIYVSTGTERAIRLRWEKMNAAAKKIFSCDSKPTKGCFAGQLLKQQDLAKTLTEISKHGTPGFYQGLIANKIVKSFAAAGGILTNEDLKNYQVKLRKPLKGMVQDYQVVSMPPPSSGGLALLQILKYMDYSLANINLNEVVGSVEYIHKLAHAMSLAFADRAELLGDTDFISVDIDALLNPKYLEKRWQDTFKKDQAHLPEKAGNIPGPQNQMEPRGETTHFSVIDQWGNAVAMTLSLNDNFGSAFVADGTGVVMNSTMDDFALAPGVPNQFGLIGNINNAIAPLKRPLSSMSPTIVRDKAGNNLLVLGAAGGPFIISSVAQVLLNRLFLKQNLGDALTIGRVHQQWRPEKIFIEKNTINFATLKSLKQMNYSIEEIYKIGSVHAVERNPITRKICAVADPRGEGEVVLQHE